MNHWGEEHTWITRKIRGPVVIIDLGAFSSREGYGESDDSLRRHECNRDRDFVVSPRLIANARLKKVSDSRLLTAQVLGDCGFDAKAYAVRPTKLDQVKTKGSDKFMNLGKQSCMTVKELAETSVVISPPGPAPQHDVTTVAERHRIEDVVLP